MNQYESSKGDVVWGTGTQPRPQPSWTLRSASLLTQMTNPKPSPTPAPGLVLHCATPPKLQSVCRSRCHPQESSPLSSIPNSITLINNAPFPGGSPEAVQSRGRESFKSTASPLTTTSSGKSVISPFNCQKTSAPGTQASV